jgi:hypothetical protein
MLGACPGALPWDKYLMDVDPDEKRDLRRQGDTAL